MSYSELSLKATSLAAGEFKNMTSPFLHSSNTFFSDKDKNIQSVTGIKTKAMVVINIVNTDPPVEVVNM